MADEKYDQEFFLALVAKGKDAWNAWRRDPANKDVRVTFAGTDFSGAPRDGIDFSGFEFGDQADFSGCKWRGVEAKEISGDSPIFKSGRAHFVGAALGNETKFTGAAFGDCVAFSGVTFGEKANLTGALFGDFADFADASFGISASFIDADFGNNAMFGDVAFDDFTSFSGAAFGYGSDFTGTIFGILTDFVSTDFGQFVRFVGTSFNGGPNFTGAAFGAQANFTGADFANGANFRETYFKGLAEFSGTSKEQRARLLASDPDREVDEEAQAVLEKRHKQSWADNRSGPDRFLKISFANARFDDEAVFSGRSFEEIADFTNSRFYRPPNFDGVTNANRIDFTGAHIGFVPQGK